MEITIDLSEFDHPDAVLTVTNAFSDVKTAVMALNVHDLLILQDDAGFSLNGCRQVFELFEHLDAYLTSRAIETEEDT